VGGAGAAQYICTADGRAAWATYTYIIIYYHHLYLYYHLSAISLSLLLSDTIITLKNLLAESISLLYLSESPRDAI